MQVITCESSTSLKEISLKTQFQEWDPFIFKTQSQFDKNLWLVQVDCKSSDHFIAIANDAPEDASCLVPHNTEAVGPQTRVIR